MDQEFLEDLAVSLLSVQPPKMKVDTMSENVLAIFHWPGDSEEMRQRYDAVLHHVVDISAARPLVHLAYSVDDGFQVVDVWSNEDMCRKMVDNPRFRELLGEHGLGHARIDIRAVHRLGWPVSETPMYR